MALYFNFLYVKYNFSVDGSVPHYVHVLNSKYLKNFMPGHYVNHLSQCVKKFITYQFKKKIFFDLIISQTGSIHRNMIRLSYLSINYRHHSNQYHSLWSYMPMLDIACRTVT